MRAQQAGEVIACDIGGDHAVGVGPDIEEFDLPSLFQMFAQWFGGRRRPSILQIMLRAGMVNSGAAAIAARQSSTLLIQPPLGSIDLLEWQAFDRAIEIGYQHTLRLLGADPELLAEQSPLLDV
jgi:NTE family protein